MMTRKIYFTYNNIFENLIENNCMEKKKKKFNKPIKDSILIAKNTRYTIEINEA
jgi:hypothetical protein